MQIILNKDQKALLLSKREDLYYPFMLGSVFNAPSSMKVAELEEIFNQKVVYKSWILKKRVARALV